MRALTHFAPVFRGLLALAAIVLILAGLRAAAPIVSLLLLSAFIAVLAMPWFVAMRSRGVPGSLALMILVLLLAIVLAGGIQLIASAIQQVNKRLPYYRQQIQTQLADLRAFLEEHGVEELNPLASETYLDTAMALAQQGASHLAGIVAAGVLVLIFVFFILFEGLILPSKIKSLPNVTDEMWTSLSTIVDNVRRYTVIKTWMSLLTGVLVAGWLYLLDVDFPLLFGLLAFLLNYIPNIGSTVAAVPGVVLALIQFGPVKAAFCAVGYSIINIAVSNGIEPRFMGERLGLSPLIVMVSMVFWGWLLGPVGMLLSVPLTMILKIALEGVEELRWIAVLMGSNPRVDEPPPPLATTRATEGELGSSEIGSEA